MAESSTTYTPRRPSDGTVYQIVRDHFETFRAQAASLRDGEGLPRFVEQEFRDFLQCGWLASGFARFRCGACGLDRLVPFSCKGRGFCPSCGGRRMAERAAHLVDHVFPDVPVRQWVLSLPHRLRYQLAWDHVLCRAVVGVYLRAVLGWLRRRAQADGVPDGRGGAVAVIQRFGGALNLNVHVHALVLDGVFARDHAGGPWCFARCLASRRWTWRRYWPRWSRGSGTSSTGGELATATPPTERRTRGRTRRPCWPASRPPPCRGPWRRGVVASRASVVSDDSAGHPVAIPIRGANASMRSRVP